MTVSYANAKSCTLRVMESLAWNMRQIRKSDGYLNTMGNVFLEAPSPSDITVYPACALIQGREVAEDEDESAGYWSKLLQVLGVFFVEEGSASQVTARRASLKQDFEARLGNNTVVRDEDGRQTCLIATLGQNEPFGMMKNQPRVGFVYDFAVRYRQDITDPTVLT